VDNPNIPGNIGYTRHMTKTKTKTHTKTATLNTKKMQQGLEGAEMTNLFALPLLIFGGCAIRSRNYLPFPGAWVVHAVFGGVNV
jgi:hypothetical protein